MKTKLTIANMTSTEIFKSQIESTMDRIRHNNSGNDTFKPTHLGGLFGQREILESKSAMRQVKIGNN